MKMGLKDGNFSPQNTVNTVPDVRPLGSFKDNDDFTQYLTDYCKNNYNIDVDIYILAGTFLYISNISKSEAWKIRELTDNYYFLTQPHYFEGRYTVQYTVNYHHLKLTDEYIAYHWQPEKLI